MKTTSSLLSLMTLVTVQTLGIESVRATEPNNLVAAAEWAQDVAIARALPYHIEPPDTLKISIRSDERDEEIEQIYKVGPDGNVYLGKFGRVYLAGLTVELAQDAIEKQLADKLESPRVDVEVTGFNSKKVYVIVMSNGAGDTIIGLPCSRESTVLQAVFAAKTGNVEDVVHVHRPLSGKKQEVQREIDLKIDLKGLILRGDLATNYGLLPGDRVIITPAKPAETANGRKETANGENQPKAEPPTLPSPDSEYYRLVP